LGPDLDGTRTWWLARCQEQLPGGASWLTAAERDFASGRRHPKRAADFLLSRWTLKLAVAALMGWAPDHATLARIEGRNAADGAPELYIDGQPDGRAISLTDRAGRAACLIADRNDPRAPAAVGCDLELIEPRSDAFVRDYLTAPEREFVTAAGRAVLAGGATTQDPSAIAVAANLIWSAKESALKVLRAGLRMDTRDVEVTITGLTPPPRSWAPLHVRHSGGELTGWWRRSDPFLFTACGYGSLAAPTGIEQSSPLDWPPAAGR
jgi:4'-phosphopantetheinyl transferase